VHSRYRSGSVSGENRVVDDESRLLREGGHEVDVYAPMLESVGGVGLLRAATSTVWSMRAADDVASRVEAWRPDVVHAHNLFPSLSPAILRSVPDSVACVMTLHNFRQMCLPGTFLRDGRVCEDCYGRGSWPGVLHGCYQGSVGASATLAASLVLHRRIGSFARVDLFVAISRFVRDMHLNAGIGTDRIVVKPHFAWPSARRTGPGSYFLYLGRLSPEKGVRTLVEAWGSIDARVLVVGEGPEREDLRRLAPVNVEFRDSVSPERVPELLQSARALIVPSISHEGAGKVVLEAYAAGVPVLASRGGGLPEVVEDGVTGVLLPPGDPVALTKGVEHLQDDAVSRRMGDAAWRFWKERHDPERALQQLEDVYRRGCGLNV
jgi:glycosyltransferase involved in cell wall biosynthesis